MPKKSPHPHVAWRDGRPRFSPGPELRAAGHAGRDLRHDDGSWYSRGEAVDWSIAFCAELAATKPKVRTKAASRPKAAAASKRPTADPRLPTAAPAAPKAQSFLTLAELFERWFASPRFLLPADAAELRRQRQAGAVLAPKSIADFRQKARVIERDDPELWFAPADALTTPVVFSLYEALVAGRGVATARGAVAVLSMALGWGRKRGLVDFRMNHGANPAQGLGMVQPPPRLRIASRAEIDALVAAADALGRPEIGDMVTLGVWTGQRQGDRLSMEDRGLVAGRRIFRQGKTGAIVAVRESPELARRLDVARERRRQPRAEALLAAKSPDERAAVERRFSRVVLNELVDPRYGKCFWRPFEGQRYTHVFAEIRAAAVAGLPDRGLKPCPSLAAFTDQDLRDTSVTWMASAGATIPEIISVTGHSPQSATAVLKHYLATHPEMADTAIGKMMAWSDAGGEVEIGL